MNKYLLDTNICIYYMKGLFNLNAKIEKADPENCYISEITLAELKFGVENSANPSKNKKALDLFLSGITVLPIYEAINIYAKEKARLRKVGTPIDDFDLLIGATSIAYQMVMVTNNANHFKRIKNIKIDNWINK